jgi:hypothetical protein
MAVLAVDLERAVGLEQVQALRLREQRSGVAGHRISSSSGMWRTIVCRAPRRRRH